MRVWCESVRAVIMRRPRPASHKARIGCLLLADNLGRRLILDAGAAFALAGADYEEQVLVIC